MEDTYRSCRSVCSDRAVVHRHHAPRADTRRHPAQPVGSSGASHTAGYRRRNRSRCPHPGPLPKGEGEKKGKKEEKEETLLLSSLVSFPVPSPLGRGLG